MSVLSDEATFEVCRILNNFPVKISDAAEKNEPSVISRYLVDLAQAFNKFYHDTKIMGEEDEQKQASYIALLVLTKKVLETCIDVLGFEAPDRM